MTNLVRILEQNGPLISSELARRLSKELNIPLNTASQKITRNKDLRKIKGFFRSNQSLIYLEEHYKDEILFEAFLNALYKYGKKYWFCLNAIKIHGGEISIKFLECYTNYPIEPLKNHLPFREVMQKFVKNGILVFGSSEYSFAPKLVRANATSLSNRTIEMIKEGILTNFHQQVRNMGIISYNTGRLFAEFGKFRWSFVGVSYVKGLVSNRRPGFLVADILFGKKIRKKDVEFFIQKLNHIQSFKNASNVIPYLIVDDLDKDAIEILKSNGVVIGFVKELFGEKYAIALKELVVILNNAGASLKSHPNKYLDLISELKVFNETLVFNIRGTLFEYLIGHYHSKKCQSIDIGREIFENNGKHEIDVFAIYDDRVVFAECKATNSPVEWQRVHKWLRVKIPAFRNWLLKQETLKEHKIQFEYWSTAGFDIQAETELEMISKSINKYQLKFFNGHDVRQFAVEMKNKKLKEIIDNYFLKTSV